MLDDFKPKKSADAARISRKPARIPPSKEALDDEIGAAFVAPDEVAAAEEAEETIEIDNQPEEDASTSVPEQEADATASVDEKPAKPPKELKDKVKWQWWPPKAWVKKQWLVVGGVALGLIILAIVLFLVLHKSPATKQSAPVTKASIKAPAKPTTVTSKLSGLEVTPDQSKLPVTGVMIENSTDARPQSGLDAASVVYEAVAEGGITRFLALFQDNQPDYVGPIRSSRPYYLRWVLPFDAGYAHVGGSPEALSDIKSLGVKDLDQFANGNSYTRIDSRDAPHNVYTSLSTLTTLEKAKGYGTSNFTGFARKKEAPIKVPEATSIDFTISGPAFSVHYDYDANTNSYKRNLAGEPHYVVSKTSTKTQITPKVVIALIMDQSAGELDASDAYYTQYNTVGTGQMYVFQDGQAIPGTWSKADDKSQFTFTDNAGKPLALNPGQTWISIMGLSGDVTYK